MQILNHARAISLAILLLFSTLYYVRLCMCCLQNHSYLLLPFLY